MYQGGARPIYKQRLTRAIYSKNLFHEERSSFTFPPKAPSDVKQKDQQPQFPSNLIVKKQIIDPFLCMLVHTISNNIQTKSHF